MRGVYGLFVLGTCRPLWLGGCGILPKDSDALASPRAEKDHINHSTHTESAQHHSANTRVACAHGTRGHVASLAKEVCE